MAALYKAEHILEGALINESAQTGFAPTPPDDYSRDETEINSDADTPTDLPSDHPLHSRPTVTTYETGKFSPSPSNIPTSPSADRIPALGQPILSTTTLSLPKMDSGNTTVTGSRAPTLKQVESDNKSVHSQHSTHTGSNDHTGGKLDHAVSNEKSLNATDEKGVALPMTGADESGLMTGAKLYLVFLSLMLTVFMFALDQSIVATAIPVIVSDFKSFQEVPWVITAYFLTQCGLILLVGQILSITKAKWVLLASIFFFELGSLLCAVAVNMPMLIFARAIQGVGAAGMFVALLAVIVTITTLKQRPAFMAAFGFVFVISSVVGPLLGGVFTERASWRWCFWINLPLGGIAAAAVIFLLPAREPLVQGERYRGWAGVKRLDFIGAGLSLAFVTCLLLALQWGGNDYPWGNWRIILLFCLGGILCVAFFLWQWKLDERALMPLSLLKNRTQLASMGAMFMLMMGMLGGTYQLPLFYQASRGRTPEQSGIDIIPFMLAVCIGIFISGGFVTKTGRYWPWLVIGPPISAVGFGLLYTVDAYTPNPRLIGFQILAGVGIGMTFQNPLVAIQVEYHDRPYLIPQANGVVSFFQLTGAALGIGIVNTVQSIFLNRELLAVAASVPYELVRQSPTAIYTLEESLRPPVIEAYTKAITESFIPIIVGIGLALISGAFIKNESTLGKTVEGGIA